MIIVGGTCRLLFLLITKILQSSSFCSNSFKGGFVSLSGSIAIMVLQIFEHESDFVIGVILAAR
jgi:hypothetical protein